MKILVAVVEYFSALKAKGYTPRTLETYETVISKFEEWLTDQGVEEIAQVDRGLVRTYQQAQVHRLSQYGRPLSLSSQSQILTALRGFFGYLVRREVLLIDPAKELELPRKRPRLIPYDLPTEKEIERLVEAPDTGTPMGIRDRAMLEVLYASGIRNSELRALRVFDVDLTDQTLTVVRGKGGKSRVVPLGEESCRWVERYLVRVRPEWAKKRKSPLMFLSCRGNGLTRQHLVWVVKRYVKTAKVHRRVTVHTFRHACASHMIKGGADVRAVQELLGHKSLTTTSVYTHVEIAHLKRVHRRCHPRATEAGSRKRRAIKSRQAE